MLVDALSPPSPSADPEAPEPDRQRHVLIPFGDEATWRRAIARAAPLLHGHRVTVLVTWRSIAPATPFARGSTRAGTFAAGVHHWQAAERERARRRGQAAVAAARELGLEAKAEVRLIDGSWAARVAAIAHERSIDVIVLERPRRSLDRALKAGRRGRTKRSPQVLVTR